MSEQLTFEVDGFSRDDLIAQARKKAAKYFGSQAVELQLSVRIVREDDDVTRYHATVWAEPGPVW